MTTSSILQGDVMDRLSELPDGSVHCVVTSPPYWGLRDYGVEGQIGLEPTPEAYVAKMVEVFRELRRVLRDDGTLWLNLGDSYAAASGARGDTRTGFNDRYFGTDNGAGKQGETASVVPAAKMPPGLKPKDLIGIPWRVAFALQADGWWLRSDIIWSKPNPMPESVRDRPTKAHEYMFLLTKSARYYYDVDAVRLPFTESTVERSKYKWQPNTPPEVHGLTNHSGNMRGRDTQAEIQNPAGRNLRSVWTIPTAPYPEAHFATFPPKLVEPCIRAGTKEGDTVLDPFAGSGTVGQVCIAERRNFIGIELNPEYCELAERRTRDVQVRAF